MQDNPEMPTVTKPNLASRGAVGFNQREIWRKRVGVEPTIRPAKDRIAGFEGREDHRTPFASAASIGVRRGPFQLSRLRPSFELTLRPGRRASGWCKLRNRDGRKLRR